MLSCVKIGFVYCYVQVFTEYFKELEEESIRDNFVIIYELLDELMDFGYPQVPYDVPKCVRYESELCSIASLWSRIGVIFMVLLTKKCISPYAY